MISPSRVGVKHSGFSWKGLEEEVGRQTEGASTGERLNTRGSTFADAFALAESKLSSGVAKLGKTLKL